MLSRLFSCCYPQSWITPAPAQDFQTPLEEMAAPSLAEEERNRAFSNQLNVNRLSTANIRSIAADILLCPSSVKNEQERLLRIVRYSAVSKRQEVAASNAISILKETGFSFRGVSFENVSIPFANLSNTILDRANFSGADCTGVNFTNSSLRRTQFNKANFDQVDFGVDFILKHSGDVLQMALFPDQKRLVSIDHNSQGSNVYIWDLVTLERVKAFSIHQGTHERPICQPIVFSPGGKYILIAYELENSKRGTLQVFDTESLHESRISIDNAQFDLFVLTATGYYLAAYGNKISLWKLSKKANGFPLLERKERLILNTIDNAVKCYAYHFGTNRLAIYKNNKISIYSLSEKYLRGLTRSPLGGDQDASTFMEFTSTGDAVLFVQNNRVCIWNIGQDNIELLFSEEIGVPGERIQTPPTICSIKSIPQTSLIGYFLQTGRKKIPGPEPREYVLGKICVRDLNDPSVLKFYDDFAGVEPKNNINMILQGNKVIRWSKSQIEQVSLERIVSNERDELPEDYTIIDARFKLDNRQIVLLTYEGMLHNFAIRTGKLSDRVREIAEHYSKEHPKLERHLWKGIQPESGVDQDPDRRYDCKISRDGTFLVGEYCVGGNKHLRISELDGGRLCYQFEKNYLAYALSEDRRHIVFLKNNELELCDIETGNSISRVLIPPKQDGLHYQIFVSPDVYPSADVIISCSSSLEEKSAIRRWKPFTQQTQQPKDELLKINWAEKRLNNLVGTVIPAEGNAQFIGTKIYCMTEGTPSSLFEWDLTTETRKTISFPTNEVDFRNGTTTFEVSKDGNYIFCANSTLLRFNYSNSFGGDIRNNHFTSYNFKCSFYLYDVQQSEWTAKYQLIRKVITDGGVQLYRISFSPDGCFVSAWNNEQVFVWEIVDSDLKLLWQKPQSLSIQETVLSNIKNLSPSNARLFRIINT